jgi:hypothetical protein
MYGIAVRSATPTTADPSPAAAESAHRARIAPEPRVNDVGRYGRGERSQNIDFVLMAGGSLPRVPARLTFNRFDEQSRRNPPIESAIEIVCPVEAKAKFR